MLFLLRIVSTEVIYFICLVCHLRELYLCMVGIIKVISVIICSRMNAGVKFGMNEILNSV